MDTSLLLITFIRFLKGYCKTSESSTQIQWFNRHQLEVNALSYTSANTLSLWFYGKSFEGKDLLHMRRTYLLIKGPDLVPLHVHHRPGSSLEKKGNIWEKSIILIIHKESNGHILI